MANIKIKKSDYPIIAKLKLSGSTWGEIAAIYGVTAGHLMDIKSEIFKGTSEADRVKNSGLGKTIIRHIALTTDDEDRRLKAAKALIDSDPDKGQADAGSQVKDDSALVREIRIELASQ